MIPIKDKYKLLLIIVGGLSKIVIIVRNEISTLSSNPEQGSSHFNSWLVGQLVVFFMAYQPL